MTVRHRTTGEYDPATGAAAVTTTDEAGKGAVFDFGLHQSGQYFQPGTMIQAGDKQLLLSPVGITAPKQGDEAIIGGVTWAIQSVKTTAPAGEAVLYECLLRR